MCIEDALRGRVAFIRLRMLYDTMLHTIICMIFMCVYVIHALCSLVLYIPRLHPPTWNDYMKSGRESGTYLKWYRHHAFRFSRRRGDARLGVGRIYGSHIRETIHIYNYVKSRHSSTLTWLQILGSLPFCAFKFGDVVMQYVCPCMLKNRTCIIMSLYN